MKKRRMLNNIAILVLAISLAGCGDVIAPFRQPAVNISGAFTNKNPAKVSQNELKKIKTLAIVDFDILSTHYKKPDPSHVAMLSILSEELEKSGRFKVVSANKFKTKQIALGISIDSDMTQSELEKKVGMITQALKCDAEIEIVQTQGKLNFASSLFQVGFTGAVDVPMKIILDVSSGKTGKTIWQQEQRVNLTATANMSTLTYKEIKALYYPVETSLINNMLTYF